MIETRYFTRGGRLFVRGLAIDRLLAHLVASESGCWLYDGTDNGHGYSTVRDEAGRKTYVHRLSYEHFIGPIPEGLELDHLCNQTRCANPTHLEPVTDVVNKRRAESRRTACRAGHPWTAENTYIRPDGYRDCRACAKARA